MDSKLTFYPTARVRAVTPEEVLEDLDDVAAVAERQVRPFRRRNVARYTSNRESWTT